MEQLASAAGEPLQRKILRQLVRRVPPLSRGAPAATTRSMRALDAALLQWPLPSAPGEPGGDGLGHELRSLLERVDAQMAATLHAVQGGSPLEEEAQALFQTLCHLRTRLVLSLPGGPGGSTPAAAPASGGSAAAATHSAIDAAGVWQQMLHRQSGDTFNTSSGTGELQMSALAAWAAVSATFGDACGGGAHAPGIDADPDPVAPGRVARVMLGLLREPAVQSSSWDAAVALCWAAAALVDDASQRRELMRLALRGPEHAGARAALASDAGLQRRAAEELVDVGNRLVVAASAAPGSIEVFGQGAATAEGAARALFPAALLCPAAALRTLVGGAAGPGGRAALCLEALRELRPLAAAPLAPAAAAAAGAADPGIAGRGTVLVALLAERLACSALLGSDADRAALAACCAALCAPGPAGQPPTLAAEALLEEAVVPALEALRGPYVINQVDLALALQLAARLLARCPAPGAALVARVRAPARRLLDWRRRRVDLSAEGLRTPLQALEQAQILLRASDELLNASGEGGGGGGGGEGQAHPPPPHLAGALGDEAAQVCAWLQQLLASGSLPGDALAAAARWAPGALRQGLVAACASLLPCCTADEGKAVLGPAGVGALLAAHLGGGGTAPPPAEGLAAAALEVGCRAAHAAALVPELAPVAGEGPDPEPGAAPSALRRRAVARLLHHLARRCQRLSAPPQGAGASLALDLRAFAELCRCAAALQGWYDCAPLEAALLLVARAAMGRADAAGRRPEAEAELRRAAQALGGGAVVAALDATSTACD